jgi:HSP20 family molecular chaperone IbpA
MTTRSTTHPTTQTQEMQSREKQALPREGTRPGWLFRPDVDIVEGSDEFVVSADLPGVDENGVSIELADGVLSIDARLAEPPDPAWRPVYAEYRTGGYQRKFALAETIDVTKIRAAMSDGVLTLNLPKVERHRPRQIQVNRSG